MPDNKILDPTEKETGKVITDKSSIETTKIPSTQQISESKVQDEQYEVIPSHINAASKVISQIYHDVGEPETPLSDAGKKVMTVVIATWEDLMPKERKRWIEEKKDYQVNEMTTKEQVHKQTGRSLASYPMYIYKVMRTLFPDFDPAERENAMKMVKKYPMFAMANKI